MAKGGYLFAHLFAAAGIRTFCIAKFSF